MVIDFLDLEQQLTFWFLVSIRVIDINRYSRARGIENKFVGGDFVVEKETGACPFDPLLNQMCDSLSGLLLRLLELMERSLQFEILLLEYLVPADKDLIVKLDNTE